MFEEEYYKTNNYKNYLQRGSLYQKTALDLCCFVGPTLKKNSKILDYGCAVGFLLEGLKALGHKNSYGYDISEWAKIQSLNKNIKMLDKIKLETFDFIFCLDVLEHMTDLNIHKFLSNFSSPNLIVRIPVSTNGKQFHLPISQRDKTHINCKTKQQWQQFLSPYYKKFSIINTSTVYDSDGVWCAVCQK